MKRLIAATALVLASFGVAQASTQATYSPTPTGCSSTYIWVNGVKRGAFSYCTGGGGLHRVLAHCVSNGAWAYGPWMGAGQLSYSSYCNGAAYEKIIQLTTG